MRNTFLDVEGVTIGFDGVDLKSAKRAASCPPSNTFLDVEGVAIGFDGVDLKSAKRAASCPPVMEGAFSYHVGGKTVIDESELGETVCGVGEQYSSHAVEDTIEITTLTNQLPVMDGFKMLWVLLLAVAGLLLLAISLPTFQGIQNHVMEIVVTQSAPLAWSQPIASADGDNNDNATSNRTWVCESPDWRFDAPTTTTTSQSGFMPSSKMPKRPEPWASAQQLCRTISSALSRSVACAVRLLNQLADSVRHCMALCLGLVVALLSLRYMPLKSDAQRTYSRLFCLLLNIFLYTATNNFGTLQAAGRFRSDNQLGPDWNADGAAEWVHVAPPGVQTVVVPHDMPLENTPLAGQAVANFEAFQDAVPGTFDVLTVQQTGLGLAGWADQCPAEYDHTPHVFPRPPRPVRGPCCHLGHTVTPRECDRCPHYCCLEHGEQIGTEWVCGHCVWGTDAATCCAQWQGHVVQLIENPALASVALANYEEFYEFPPGSATFMQVNASAAGREVWGRVLRRRRTAAGREVWGRVLRGRRSLETVTRTRRRRSSGSSDDVVDDTVDPQGIQVADDTVDPRNTQGVIDSSLDLERDLELLLSQEFPIMLVPSSLDRQNGSPTVPAGDAAARLPPWVSSGVPVARLVFDRFCKAKVTGYQPPPCAPGTQFLWGETGGQDLGDVTLEPGSYACVRCQGEDFLRMLLTTPAALGAAGGHPGLASGEPVLFAGEVQLGRGGELVAWTLVSGTYQISDDLMYQSSLPRELYWRFVTEDEVGLHDVTGARVLRG